MNKFVRFVFLSVFLTFFLPVSTWAAIPSVTGTYAVVGAKYIAPKLASCTGVTITVKITKQCGRLLKGSITMAGTTIPVTGRLESDNKSLLLNGSSGPGYQYFVLGGEYQSSTSSINVNSFTSGLDSTPENAEFDYFILKKQP